MRVKRGTNLTTGETDVPFPLAPEVPPRRDGLREAREVVALLRVPPVCCREDNTYDGGAENFRGAVLEALSAPPPAEPPPWGSLTQAERYERWHSEKFCPRDAGGCMCSCHEGYAATPEPPDSGDGAALIPLAPLAEYAREVRARDAGDAAARMLDRLDRAIDRAATNGKVDARTMHLFVADLRAEPRDAGIDAARLYGAMQAAATCSSTVQYHLRVADHYNALRAAAPAEAREEGRELTDSESAAEEATWD